MKTRSYTEYELDETDPITVTPHQGRISLHDSLYFAVRMSVDVAEKLGEDLLNAVSKMAGGGNGDS